MDLDTIIKRLPYQDPFLFVDELMGISETGAQGTFQFKSDSAFYRGHFKEYPITPGVILTECCAQIGLVCLGIHLMDKLDVEQNKGLYQIAMSSTQMEFLKAVLPNETVRVVSEKEYFRFNKLKCRVKMYNAKDELVCRGILSGMIILKSDGK